MSQHLPEHLDPWRFADLGKRISGSYLLGDLPRLREYLVDSQGEVSFTLEFSRDRRQRSCLFGKVEATLMLECQRCLDAMPWQVKSDVSVAFVEGIDEAERLPDELDPELVEDGQVKLRDLVEDELLLALPQVPMHPSGKCTGQLDGESEDSNDAVRENPFAVLAELKRDK
ncbi:MAG: YceD family protein [Pseudomonadota bacterium]